MMRPALPRQVRSPHILSMQTGLDADMSGGVSIEVAVGSGADAAAIVGVDGASMVTSVPNQFARSSAPILSPDILLRSSGLSDISAGISMILVPVSPTTSNMIFAKYPDPLTQSAPESLNIILIRS